MLHWFAKRLNELHKEDRKGEKGFTLIELLVVVIIIGILAAIAIPTFLSQRDKANRAAIESDLRNASSAATSCSASNTNNGKYKAPPTGALDCSSVPVLQTFGFNPTDGVTVNPAATTSDVWTASGSSTKVAATGTFSTAGTNAGRVVMTG